MQTIKNVIFSFFKNTPSVCREWDAFAAVIFKFATWMTVNASEQRTNDVNLIILFEKLISLSLSLSSNKKTREQKTDHSRRSFLFASTTAQMDGNVIMVNLLWNVSGKAFLSTCKNDAKRHMFLQFAHKKLKKSWNKQNTHRHKHIQVWKKKMKIKIIIVICLKVI